jgi:AcrR family transcriptional regulator
MARPKSDDKRNAILEAAIAEFALRGVWTTPTSAISRAAGVAEGTLFVYFASKEILVNELYRSLKLELADAMLSTYPSEAQVREKFEHIWNHYVGWGVANPLKLKVMAQLRVSDQVTEESRAFGLAPFAELERLAKDCIKRKIIRKRPLPFIGAMFGSLAEATMGFVASAGRSRTDYCAAGFEILWKGLAED